MLVSCCMLVLLHRELMGLKDEVSHKVIQTFMSNNHTVVIVLFSESSYIPPSKILQCKILL